MKDISGMYVEHIALLEEREAICERVDTSRKKLTELVSPFYWDFQYKLCELEKMFGIPVRQLHLYVIPKLFVFKCAECEKGIAKEISNRSRATMQYEKENICTACYKKMMARPKCYETGCECGGCYGCPHIV